MSGPRGGVRLSAGPLRLHLAPEVGGSVARFDHIDANGVTPIFRPAPEAMADVLQAGCFPLVPFCNRVRSGRFRFGGREIVLAPNLPPQPHPLHGQGWRAAWRVAKHSGVVAELVYAHHPGEWPWAYEARQRFTLTPDALEIVLSCRNLSAEPMPCGLGLHPFFVADAQTVLDAAVETVWTVDDEIMPVAEQPAIGRYDLRDRRISGAALDNGYGGWSGEARITWPAAGLALLIRSPDARRFQVYAPPEGGLFCAEPVTNANDVFSNPAAQWEALGLTLLAEGEEARLATVFQVTAGQAARESSAV